MAMGLNPGRMRDRIDILKATRQNTPTGPVTVWEPTVTRWASVNEIGVSGAAQYGTAGITDITHEVILRTDQAPTLGGTIFRKGELLLQPLRPTRKAWNRLTVPCKQLDTLPGSDYEEVPGGE